MKARRHQPRAGEDDVESNQLSSNEVRYGEKGPLWFYPSRVRGPAPAQGQIVSRIMVGVLLCLTPQTKQHAWLTLHATPTPPPTENGSVPEAAGCWQWQQVPWPGSCCGPRSRGSNFVKERGATTRLHCETTAGALALRRARRHPRELGAADRDALQSEVPGHRVTAAADAAELLFASACRIVFDNRAVKNFLCQTGVPGDPEVHNGTSGARREPLRLAVIKQVDPQWLDLTEGRECTATAPVRCAGPVPRASRGPRTRRAGRRNFFSRSLGI